MLRDLFTIFVIWLIIVQNVCCVCGDSLEIVESACVVVLKLDVKICCCFLVWTRTMRISSSFMMRLVLGNVILVLGYGSCTLLPVGFSGRGRGETLALLRFRSRIVFSNVSHLFQGSLCAAEYTTFLLYGL